MVPKNCHIGCRMMSNTRRKLAKQAESHIRTRKIKTKGKEYEQTYLFIPKLVATDTAFPFMKNERVTITIDIKKKSLTVAKKHS